MMNSEISTGTKINQGTTGKYKSVPGVTRNKHYYIYRGTNTQELVRRIHDLSHWHRQKTILYYLVMA